MIHYHPPKSQVWGHQVGRLTAAQVVGLSFRFVKEQCTITNSQQSELTLGWNVIKRPEVSAIADDAGVALGGATFEHERPDVRPDAVGETYRIRRWKIGGDDLPKVASWFDRISGPIATYEVTAHCSIGWFFAWRDEPLPLRKFESAGGHFMIHLGSPHRISTAFSFWSIEKYDEIKQYLQAIGLAELSDRHLTPKAEMRRLGRVK
jgi:hypothetical protein